jgi:hypothetical protein
MTSKYYITASLLVCCGILLSACGISEEVLSTNTFIAVTFTASSRTSAPTIFSTTIASHTPAPTSTLNLKSTSTNIPTPSNTPTPGVTAILDETQAPDASPWDRYQPRTIKEIIEQNLSETETLLDNSIFMNFGDDYASRVDVTYTGQFRDVSEGKLLLISTWLRSWAPQLSEQDIHEIFKTEGKFIEDNTAYWLPIQSQLVPFMKEELKKDDKVTLLLVWPGIVKYSNQIEWIFLVNTFPVSEP